MRDNTKAFCRIVAESFDCPGPIYEFGSYQTRDQVEYANLRGLFLGRRFVGCDLRAGPGRRRLRVRWPRRAGRPTGIRQRRIEEYARRGR